ncbi:MAG: UvrD-helicase domain-containing protein [Actinomycetota bacterium]
MQPNDLLAGLDREQREAVICGATATIVHAGAGSGKTRVLTNRIAYRIATNTASAQHVLAITFTREAASEMRRRLKRLGIDDSNGSPTVGTFHAVALSMLRQRLASQGSSMPNIVHNRPNLVVTAAGASPLGSRTKELLIEVDWAHARMVSPADYVAAVKREQRTTFADPKDIAAVYRDYEALKRKRHVVDLDDLLLRVVEDMRSDQAYAEAVRWRFQHLFVDEAQDMNPLQYALFDAIRGGREDVFVVGDPLQAIYGWNGADRMLFDALPTTVGRTTVRSLPNNYRCSPHIVAAARHVANQTKEPVHIRATRTTGEPVRVVSFSNEDTEAKGIADLLWHYAPTAGANPWESVAILVRTNNQATLIARALKAAGIPVKSTRQPAEITAAVALAAQSTSRHSLAAWASDTIEESEDDAERTVAGLVKQFLADDSTGLVDGRAFAAWVTASANTQTVTPGVEILTFHGAKGREWNYVVVAGAEAGLLPHSSAKTPSQKAEETRLAYVALTRAGNDLTITWARSRNGRTSKASPLLDGMPTIDDRLSPPQSTTRESTPSVSAPGLIEELAQWRAARAKSLFQLPDEVCSHDDLRSVATSLPSSVDELAEIFGPLTASRVSGEILPIVAAHRATTRAS